jgi:hypothetical protein
MIGTPVMKCNPTLDSKKDNENIAAQMGANEMVLGAVRALCEFSPHVSQGQSK